MDSLQMLEDALVFWEDHLRKLTSPFDAQGREMTISRIARIKKKIAIANMFYRGECRKPAWLIA